VPVSSLLPHAQVNMRLLPKVRVEARKPLRRHHRLRHCERRRGNPSASRVVCESSNAINKKSELDAKVLSPQLISHTQYRGRSPCRRRSRPQQVSVFRARRHVPDMAPELTGNCCDRSVITSAKQSPERCTHSPPDGRSQPQNLSLKQGSSPLSQPSHLQQVGMRHRNTDVP
jgi:hypothetical protein